MKPAAMTIESQLGELARAVRDFALAVTSLSEELFLEKLNHWTPRDVTAHLIGWNRYVIEGGRQILRGELPFYDIDPGENYSKVNATLIREYSSTSRVALLEELHASARELEGFLRSLDSTEWSRDTGVRHRGSMITVQNTVDDLIEDYAHHRRQIEEWTGGLASS